MSDSAAAIPSSYIVRGAGDEQFNGVYKPDGMQDGTTKWRKIGGRQTINRNGGAYWFICIDYEGSHYLMTSASDTPPLSGWAVGHGSIDFSVPGTAPAPNLLTGPVQTSDDEVAVTGERSCSDSGGATAKFPGRATPCIKTCPSNGQ